MTEDKQPDKLQLYTSKEAASLLGVTPRTIQLWSDSGILKPYKTPGGHRRFYASDIEVLAVKNTHQAPGKEPADNARVLIAEDEPDLRMLYEMNIDSWKLPVELTIAADGYDALIQFGRIHPHLLILDLNMPRIDGFHMLNMVDNQNNKGDTEIIVVTSLSKEAILDHGGIPADVKIFSKPIPFESIKNILESRIRTMSL